MPSTARSALPRLSSATLDRLPRDVDRPAAAVRRAGVGIVHLGLGAFHRAHQAVFTDAAMATAGGNWATVGVSMRSAATRDALVPQDGLYTVLEQSAAGDRAQVIGGLREILVAPEDPAAVIDRLAAPATRIVSLTVTEKGYGGDPATGRLDTATPAIAADLDVLARPAKAESTALPRTALGLMTAGLARRRAAGAPAPAMMSCDNLPANGETFARLLTAFAREIDPGLADWLAETAAFPSTMVDRIVPATTDALRARTADILGLEDAWPVATEPFNQWVVEDRFPLGRPAWDAVGARLVDDVAPWEAMKLRLLNGSHSLMAYLGQLAGLETIADCMAEPALARLVRAMMDKEVTPTLATPPGADVEGYKDALIERFANPALRHRTAQIAQDGSQKLPQRLLAPIRQRLAAGARFDRLALGVAAWIAYAGGVGDPAGSRTVDDPLAERFAAARAAAGGDPRALLQEFLAIEPVFGPDLPRNGAFVETVGGRLDRLARDGARSTIGA